MNYKSRQLNFGFSLLEFLLALFLLALSLIGWDMSQLKIMQVARQDYYFSQAIDQINLLKDEARDANEINDIFFKWKKNIAKILPQARISWHESRARYRLKLTWGGFKLKNCSKLGSIQCISILIAKNTDSQF